MKLKNGKIKNINKKLLTGALVFTLISTSFVACSDESRFDYSVNKQGEYEVSGTLDYNIFENCYFIVIENIAYDTNEYYITYRSTNYYRATPISHKYTNVLNNQLVINAEIDSPEIDGSRNILSEENISDYLYATNNIKGTYTKEDVEEILEQLRQNYINKNNKQKVKE